ncbi:hypothetical protein TWF481_008823 [Arthrobotrys musiformis]|uniref:WW domain-containing protein n=1 Tax=Arthrobotrys musiformis TaxID=47236 RepID=A0AAV9W8B2_9PEZI
MEYASSSDSDLESDAGPSGRGRSGLQATAHCHIPEMPQPNYDPRPIPPGWISAYDRGKGRAYYTDTNFVPDATFWKHPGDMKYDPARYGRRFTAEEVSKGRKYGYRITHVVEWTKNLRCPAEAKVSYRWRDSAHPRMAEPGLEASGGDYDETQYSEEGEDYDETQYYGEGDGEDETQYYELEGDNGTQYYELEGKDETQHYEEEEEYPQREQPGGRREKIDKGKSKCTSYSNPPAGPPKARYDDDRSGGTSTREEDSRDDRGRRNNRKTAPSPSFGSETIGSTSRSCEGRSGQHKAPAAARRPSSKKPLNPNDTFRQPPHQSTGRSSEGSPQRYPEFIPHLQSPEISPMQSPEPRGRCGPRKTTTDPETSPRTKPYKPVLKHKPVSNPGRPSEKDERPRQAEPTAQAKPQGQAKIARPAKTVVGDKPPGQAKVRKQVRIVRSSRDSISTADGPPSQPPPLVMPPRDPPLGQPRWKAYVAPDFDFSHIPRSGILLMPHYLNPYVEPPPSPPPPPFNSPAGMGAEPGISRAMSPTREREMDPEDIDYGLTTPDEDPNPPRETDPDMLFYSDPNRGTPFDNRGRVPAKAPPSSPTDIAAGNRTMRLTQQVPATTLNTNSAETAIKNEVAQELPHSSGQPPVQPPIQPSNPTEEDLAPLAKTETRYLLENLNLLREQVKQGREAPGGQSSEDLERIEELLAQTKQPTSSLTSITKGIRKMLGLRVPTPADRAAKQDFKDARRECKEAKRSLLYQQTYNAGAELLRRKSDFVHGANLFRTQTAGADTDYFGHQFYDQVPEFAPAHRVPRGRDITLDKGEFKRLVTEGKPLSSSINSSGSLPSFAYSDASGSYARRPNPIDQAVYAMDTSMPANFRPSPNAPIGYAVGPGAERRRTARREDIDPNELYTPAPSPPRGYGDAPAMVSDTLFRRHESEMERKGTAFLRENWADVSQGEEIDARYGELGSGKFGAGTPTAIKRQINNMGFERPANRPAIFGGDTRRHEPNVPRS